MKELEIKRPRTPAVEAKGVVWVLPKDPQSIAYFQEEGLSIRNEKTRDTIRLSQGRNELPLGEYRLEPDVSPVGIKITPRRFTLTVKNEAIINLTRVLTSDGPSGGAPLDPMRPPPGGSPFPPPPPPPHGPPTRR
jgi:hypothetical protein